MVTAKRARATGLLVLVLMFAVGALSGAVTMRMTDAGSERGETEAVRERRPSLWERLELTPEQRVQVDGIMERRRGEVEAFWSEHGPQLRAIMKSARADVREVLTPEQRELEEKLYAERRRHYEDHDR